MRNADVDECLEQIVPLCESVAERIQRYGITEESIATDSSHLDLVLMPIFQIGELVGSKTYYDALQEAHPSDIWFQAYGLRNRIAHGYGKLSPAIVWETATTSIPELLDLCKKMLADNQS